jgi:hypothetical protein
MDNLKFDVNGVKNLLLNIYENKPHFPITSKKSLVSALGGKSKKIKIHNDAADIPVSKLAEIAFSNKNEFIDSCQIVDSIIGGSFINLIVKSNILQLINNLNYPIYDEEQLAQYLVGIKIYGLDPEDITETIAYPIREPHELTKKFGASYAEIFESDIGLLDGISELESVIPMPTKKEPIELKQLEYYRCYIIEESKPKYCFEVFEDALTKGAKGLCITRTHPKQLISKYESIGRNSEVIWLTDRESVGEFKTVSPMISSVNFVIEEFIDNNAGAIILFDGLEYLITVNSFKPVLFFIQGIKDKIAENESSLLFSASPITFNKEELIILEREFEIVHEGERLKVELKTIGKVFSKIEETKKLLDEAIDKIHKDKVKIPAETTTKEKIDKIVSKIKDDDVMMDIETSGIIDTDLELNLSKKISSIDAKESTDSESEPEQDKTDQVSEEIVIPKGEEPCRSCEGTGKCIWCDVTGNCETCKGKGVKKDGSQCSDCKGTGQCRSCEGSGKCRWCKGRGY